MTHRMLTDSHVQTRWVTHVWVTRIGTLLSRIGMNSDRMAVKATTTRKTWRRLTALQMPVAACKDGESRIELRANWGDRERRW